VTLRRAAATYQPSAEIDIAFGQTILKKCPSQRPRDLFSPACNGIFRLLICPLCLRSHKLGIDLRVDGVWVRRPTSQIDRR
jgi:hypothetical protein